MKKRSFRNVLTKSFASLLLVAMLLSDSSVRVLAEPVDPVSDPEIVITQPEETAPEGGEAQEGQISAPEAAEGAQPGEEDGDENVENGEEDPNAEDPDVLPEGAAGEDEEAEEDDFEEVFIDGFTVETAHGRATRLAANHVNALSEKSRGDYFHRFYNQLTDDQKRFYDFLYDNSDEFITKSYATGDDAAFEYVIYEGENKTATDLETAATDLFDSVVYDAIGAYIWDNPESFWWCIDNFDFGFSGQVRSTDTGIVYNKIVMTIRPLEGKTFLHDRYSLADEAAARAKINSDKSGIDAVINEILNSDGYRACTTVTEKAGYINDRLTYYNYYNRYVAEDESANVGKFPHIAPSALNPSLPWLTEEGDMGSEDAPVCEAYSLAFKAICKRADIPCVVVTGDGHAWNYIQTEDGVWYAVDTTWDDPIRDDPDDWDDLEYSVRETPADYVRRWFMVGLNTKCVPGDNRTFVAAGHHANSAYLIGARPPAWPSVSTTVCPDATLGPTLATVDVPTASAGKITAKFDTDKAGKYYWVVREAGSDAPTIYEVQDGVETVTGGSGNGTISDAQASSADPFEFTTGVLPAGDYDLYIMQLASGEYLSNMIVYEDVNVTNSFASISLTPFLQNSSRKIPRNNALYISEGYQVEYTVEPAELKNEVEVTIEAENTNISIDQDDLMIFPDQPGTCRIRLKGVYTEGGSSFTQYSDWLEVTTIYPVGRLFEYYGLRYATAEDELYTGWLTNTNGVFQTRRMDGNYKVYYFAPDTESAVRSRMPGEKCEKTITMQGGNDKTYLFDENGVLIKEWIKLTGITIEDIPAGANKTGDIADNSLSYGSTYKLTAKVTPREPVPTNDSLAPVWESSDPSVVKVTPLGTGNGEIYARIDVLKQSATPVTITLTAGEESVYKHNVDPGDDNPYDNRVPATITVKATYPVGWHKIDGRTYYGEVSGDVVVNATGWRRASDNNPINGKDYYFEESGPAAGAMVTGIVEIGGHTYDFGPDGVCRGEIVLEGFVDLPEGTFYYDSDHNLVKNAIVSDKHGNHFYLDATDGHVVKGGWIDYNPGTGNLCLYAGADGVLAEGICVVGGHTFCFTDTVVGTQTYPCTLQYGFYEYQGNTYYSYTDTSAENCFMAFGYFTDGTDFYYAALQNSKTPGVLQSGWVLVDGAWRSFDVAPSYKELSSSSTNGWINVGSTGKRYYRRSNGNFLKGWQTIDGKRYYFDVDGSVVSGLLKIGSYFYYFGENNDWDETHNVPNPDDDLGIMQTGRVTYTINKEGVDTVHTSFFNTSGARQTGWQKYTGADGDKWDFFDPSSEYGDSLGATSVAGKPGWYSIGDAKYHFINNTTLAKGWQTVDGGRYYFDTAVDDNGAQGRMAVGIKQIGSYKYYLRENEAEGVGTLLTGHGFAKDAGGTDHEYYANSNGVLQLGWQRIGTQFAFFDYEKGYRLTGRDEISGTDNWVVITGTDGAIYKYYLKNATTPVTGLQTIDGRKYLFGNVGNDKNYGRLLTGLVKFGNYYYYGTRYGNTEADARALTAGELKRGLFTEDGITRYANDNGVIQTGWVAVDGVNRYFLTEKDVTLYGGSVGQNIPINRVGENFLGCEWYKAEDGSLFDGMYFCFRSGTTPLKGWQSVNGYRYYFDPATGAQWTGVKQIGSYWYDLGGAAVNGFMGNYMKTGWSDGTAAASNYYYASNGTRVTGWNNIDGKRYFFRQQARGEVLDGDEYGKKQKNIVLVQGSNRYVLDAAEGRMMTGYPCALGTDTYCTNSNGVMLYGWQIIDGVAHYFRPAADEHPGKEVAATIGDDNFISINDGTMRYFYLNTGKTMVTGFRDIAGTKYYFYEKADDTHMLGEMATGWFERSRKFYFAYDDGKLAKGYCIDPAGDGYNYYFDNNGAMLSGLYLINGEYHYFNPDADSAEYGAERFLTAYDGAPAGFYKTGAPENRIVYLVKGRLMTGWQTVEGRKYRFDTTGTLQTGEFKIGNVWYCSYTMSEAEAAGDAALTGSIRTGIKHITDNDGRSHTMYYDGNGKRLTGWVSYDGGYHYFDPVTGYMKTGCIKVGNYTYFTDADGKRLTGLVKYNGDTYYCDGSGIARSGWQTVRIDGVNRKFYFDTFGVMQTGLLKIGSYWYFFNQGAGDLHGMVMTGRFDVTEGGQTYSYYANSSGVLQFGLYVFDGYMHYFANEYEGDAYDARIGADCAIVGYPVGDAVANWYKITVGTHDIIVYAQNGTKIYKGWNTVIGLDGIRHKYYFNPSNGEMMTGYVTVSGRIYKLGDDPTDLATYGTFDAATMTGFDPDPAAVYDAPKYYYFDKNGVSVTGWITYNGDSYYLYPDGTLALGLQKISGYNYYFDKTNGADFGTMIKSSDVIDDDGKIYLFGSNGRMLTGWQKDADGSYRYFGPELIKGVTYTRNGRSFNVARIGNYLYMLDADGKRYPQAADPGITKGYNILTGTYTDGNSRIYTGWQKISVNGVTRQMYFSPDTGVCFTSNASDYGQSYANYCDGPVKIGNYFYFFDAQGAMATGETNVNTHSVNETYLFASGGNMLTGLQKVGNEFMFFHKETGVKVPITHRPVGADEWLLLTVDGQPVRYYIRRGRAVTGWQKLTCAFSADQKTFYFNGDGTLLYTDEEPGEIRVGSYTYHTAILPTNPDSSDFGYVITGFYRRADGDNRWSYSDGNGKALTGWVKVDGRQYYFSPNGFMCTGVTDISGRKYYFSDSDAASPDPADGVYGVLKTGEFHATVPDADYKANSAGVLVTGWGMTRDAAGNYIPTFYSTDIAAYGQKQTVTPQYNGAAATGWYVMNGKWYLIEQGRYLRKGLYNQKITVGGATTTYRFCLDAATGELVERADGLVKVGSYRYYSENNAIAAGYPSYYIRTGKFDIGDDTYFADGNGILKTGLVNETRNRVNYLQLYNAEDCKQVKSGFVSFNNSVYYAYTADDATNARIPANFAVGDLAKGRVALADGNYYFNGNGVRLYGWQSFKEADNKTYKYYYDTDGKRFENGLKTIAGKSYYFIDGKLQTGAFVDGGSYVTDTSGAILKGWNLVKDPATNTSRWRYYAQADGKELTKTGADPDNEMIFSPGEIAGNYWGIVKENGVVSAYHIYNNRSVARNGWYSINSRRYFFNANGQLDDSGENADLIADATGTPIVHVEVKVKTAGANRFCVYPVDYAQTPGSDDFGGYAVNGFVEDAGNNLYFANSNGQFIKGYVTLKRDNVNWKYYGDDLYRLLTGPSYIGSTKYLFDDAANLGRLLSIDHAGNDGMVEYDHKKFLTDKNGVILTGWRSVTDSGRVSSWHYFAPATGEETAVTEWDGNWVTLTDESTFYFENRRTLKKGFITVDGNMYYLDSSTGALMRAPAGDGFIRFTVGNETYEVDETGVITRGWSRDVTGAGPINTQAESYFDMRYGRLVRGSYTVTGDGLGIYYFDNNGVMAKGITTIGGKKYMYGKNTGAVMVGGNPDSEISYDRGKLHKSYYGTLDNTGDKYRSDGYGVLTTGWQYFTTEGAADWHFFDPATGKEYASTSATDGSFTWRTITDLPGGRAKFCFRGTKLLTGWQTVNGRKYYFDGIGKMAVGFVKIGNATYVFNETISASDPSLEGSLMTGGVANAGGKYYYLTSSGSYRTGWFTVSGARYYGDPATGELAIGFKRIDGSTYYFSEAESTRGQMQTGFIRIADLGQSYYDRADGASNTYYADTNGAIVTSGWKNIKLNPGVSTTQEWSYYFAPNMPDKDLDEFTLTGELVTGDVLIDDNGNVTYMDNGAGDNDGFGASTENICNYYRFDPETGARRKEVLYFYGNYYGMSIDNDQKNTISSMRRFINSDTKFVTESDDFILVNYDTEQVKRKGLTRFTTSTFPMCASNKVDDEKSKYVAANDIAKIVGGVVMQGADGHVDVCDVELYSKDVYDRAIAKYGPRNTVLMGSSSGAGICIGLYAYAIEQQDDSKLPAQLLLMSPWLDVSMSNPDCRKIAARYAGPTDVDTLRYWGARYTRDRNYSDEDGTPYAADDVAGPGVYYPFANSLCLDMDGMKNIIMYTGTYDPCIYDCDRFVSLAKQMGCTGVVNNRYASMQHGFMFFANNSSSRGVTMDICRRVMTQ